MGIRSVDAVSQHTGDECTWRGQRFAGTIDDYMNKLGYEGWELVASTQVWGANSDNDQLIYVFKRPL